MVVAVYEQLEAGNTELLLLEEETDEVLE